MLYISFNYRELHRLKEAVFAPHMVNAGFIGSDSSGKKPLGNQGSGIDIKGFRPETHRIERNLISANGRYGVLVDDDPLKVIIRGNLIGTDITQANFRLGMEKMAFTSRMKRTSAELNRVWEIP